MIDWSEQPKGLIICNPKMREVTRPKLTGGEHTTLTPGFFHFLMCLTSCINYALKHDYYVWLDDADWEYGHWKDYFEPFWNEEKQRKILSLNLPIIDGDVFNEKNDFGLNYLKLAQNIPPVVNQFSLFKINNNMQEYIIQTIKEVGLPNRYSACQIRLGDMQLRRGFTLQDRLDEIDNVVDNNIFIMTDDYSAIEYIKKHTNYDIYSATPKSYDGDPKKIRTAENLKLLLAEIIIAQKAANFISSPSQVSNFVHMINASRAAARARSQ